MTIVMQISNNRYDSRNHHRSIAMVAVEYQEENKKCIRRIRVNVNQKEGLRRIEMRRRGYMKNIIITGENVELHEGNK